LAFEKMTTAYEKRLAALGITNRGQLATGFEDGGFILQNREAHFIDPKASRVAKAPPLEDLSALNPATTRPYQTRVKRIWRGLSEAEKKRRSKLNAIAAMEGGKATKGTHHRR
jgi:hypothetical protein